MIVRVPTDREIVATLFGDPSASEWSASAREQLEDDLLGVLGNVYELVERVTSDLRDDVVQLEVDARREDTPITEAEELRGLARVAKRAAIRLLYAAWTAEEHARILEVSGS